MYSVEIWNSSGSQEYVVQVRKFRTIGNWNFTGAERVDASWRAVESKEGEKVGAPTRVGARNGLKSFDGETEAAGEDEGWVEEEASRRPRRG